MCRTATRDVHASREQDVSLQMDEPQMASWPYVHVRIETRAGLAEDCPELNRGRAVAVGDCVREESATHILANEPGHEANGLARSLERTIGAEHGPTREEGCECRHDRQRRHA